MINTFKNDALTPPATAPIPPVCGLLETEFHASPKPAAISG